MVVVIILILKLLMILLLIMNELEYSRVSKSLILSIICYCYVNGIIIFVYILNFDPTYHNNNDDDDDAKL
jgi:amino acid permease